MKKVSLILIIIFAIFFTGCMKNSKDKIVIYTAMEEERTQDFKKMIKEKFPNKNIHVERMSTGNIAAKIKTEKKNIEADIIVDLESAHLENLKDNFYDLSEFDLSHYVDDINPKHHKYVIWSKFHAGIILNKKFIKDKGLSIPKSYDDLLKDEYKGLISMPDPLTSGTGYAYYLNVINEKGLTNANKYFRELTKNMKQYTASGSGPVSLLKKNEIAIAMGMRYQGVEEISKGADYEIIEFATGSPYNVTGTAIINGKENKKDVKEVFKWIIKEFNLHDKENFVPGKILKEQNNKIEGYIPVKKDANMKGIEDILLKDKLLKEWENK